MGENFMQVEIGKRTTQGTWGVCTLSALYVALVTLIPVLGFGAKGTMLNTLIKAGVFIVYLGAIFIFSNFQMSAGGGKAYIPFVYFISQCFCLAYSPYPFSIVEVATQTAMLFALFVLLPNVRGSKQDMVRGIKIFVLFDISAIIYNLIVYFDRIITLSFLTNVYYDMFSFFDNKNTYGKILFVTLVLLFYWRSLCDEEDVQTKKHINKLMYLQMFAIATSMCRSALLCSLIFLLCNYLKYASPRRVIEAVSLCVAGGVLFCIPGVREYLLHILFRVEVDTYREPIVEASKVLVRENLLYGCGQSGWEQILDKISGNAYSHNGFLSVLMNGGILYFSAYIVIIIRALIGAFQVKKENRELGSQIFIFLVAVMVYSFFEATVLCETNAANFAFTIAALILPQMYLNMSHGAVNNSQEMKEAR